MEPAIIIPIPVNGKPEPELFGIQYNQFGVVILVQTANGWEKWIGEIPFQVAIHVTAIAQAGFASQAAMNAASNMIGAFMKPGEPAKESTPEGATVQ